MRKRIIQDNGSHKFEWWVRQIMELDEFDPEVGAIRRARKQQNRCGARTKKQGRPCRMLTVVWDHPISGEEQSWRCRFHNGLGQCKVWWRLWLAKHPNTVVPSPPPWYHRHVRLRRQMWRAMHGGAQIKPSGPWRNSCRAKTTQYDVKLLRSYSTEVMAVLSALPSPPKST